MNTEMRSDAALANQIVGRLIIGALKRLGVDHFVVSPGSRSTPLVVAVAELGEDAYTVCLDERSAAFHALGRIKASQGPVALVCTSGTAGAHYYPAVIEARESGLPLIILTADRPAELHHCHAGQTVEQERLFGEFVTFQANLPIPEPDQLLMRQVRELCRRAVEEAMQAPMGPVHVNCPFREPFFDLESRHEESDVDGMLTALEPVETAITQSVKQGKPLPEKTLILAGPRPGLDSEDDLAGLLELSRRHAWPILADGVNPLRYVDPNGGWVVTRYDQIVRDDALWTRLQPEAVLLWGEPPTSKVLRQRLASLDIEGYQLGTGKRGMNPFHGRIQWLGGTIQAAVQQLSGQAGNFAEKWSVAESEANAYLERAFAKPHDLFEGDIHRMLSEHLPEGAHVFFTSSLAVRDAEWFMPARKGRIYPFSQRGANGIDGTLSMARGIASGSGKPVYLVTGDLAFLHDSNGLLGASEQTPGVFVILINNSGGGIFELLPVARQAVAFEQVFATPQRVDFKQLIQAHGGRHTLCGSLSELKWEMDEWDQRGLCVTELPVDRKTSAGLHRRLLKGKDLD